MPTKSIRDRYEYERLVIHALALVGPLVISLTVLQIVQ